MNTFYFTTRDCPAYQECQVKQVLKGKDYLDLRWALGVKS